MIPPTDLVSQFGSPLYVYDLDRVDAARRDLLDDLPEQFQLFYSLKANPHPDVARAIREGADGRCRAEISSYGELRAALAAGYLGGDCLYTGPGKTAEEVRWAIEAGVRLFSIESLTDLNRVAATARSAGVTVDCLLRINDTGTQAAAGLRMSGSSQFGFELQTVPELLPLVVGVPGCRVVGAHLFPISNARDEATLAEEFKRSLDVAARLHDSGLPIEFLDIGGGFAAPYAAPGDRPRYRGLESALTKALAAAFPQWPHDGPQLACESGRYLVGDCGYLITRVMSVKVERDRTFVVLDAGINALGGLSGLGRLFPLAARPAPATFNSSGGTTTITLVGPLCTTGDVIGRDIEVGPLTVGDLVTIPNVGAYGLTASLLAFLSRTPPRELVVRGDRVVSSSQLLVERMHSAVDGAR